MLLDCGATSLSALNHRGRLTARRVIITHMSADMLGHQQETRFEAARDGLVISL